MDRMSQSSFTGVKGIVKDCDFTKGIAMFLQSSLGQFQMWDCLYHQFCVLPGSLTTSAAIFTASSYDVSNSIIIKQAVRVTSRYTPAPVLPVGAQHLVRRRADAT